MNIVACACEGPYASLVIRDLLAGSPRDRLVGIVLGRGLTWDGLGHKAIAGAAAAIGLLPTPSIADLASVYEIPLLRSADVNGSGAVAWIAARKPDLLLSVYFNQRIQTPLLHLAGGRVREARADQDRRPRSICEFVDVCLMDPS